MIANYGPRWHHNLMDITIKKNLEMYSLKGYTIETLVVESKALKKIPWSESAKR